jgi:GT2 family glycosyltransferase
MFDLSIVIPTCNRAQLLRRNLASLRDVRCSFEVIVVDGASEDGTAQVLADAGRDFGDRLKVIREEQRQGFVRAANKGFRAAAGRNMIWLNDDALALPGTLDEAVRQIDLASNVIRLPRLFTTAGPFVCAMSVERFMQISPSDGGRRINSSDILTSGSTFTGQTPICR